MYNIVMKLTKELWVTELYTHFNCEFCYFYRKIIFNLSIFIYFNLSGIMIIA